MDRSHIFRKLWGMKVTSFPIRAPLCFFWSTQCLHSRRFQETVEACGAADTNPAPRCYHRTPVFGSISPRQTKRFFATVRRIAACSGDDNSTIFTGMSIEWPVQASHCVGDHAMQARQGDEVEAECVERHEWENSGWSWRRTSRY